MFGQSGTDAQRSQWLPGVVTGSQVTLPADGGTYTLYYLFPMTEQQDTLQLVRRALVTGGGLLLVLVGGLNAGGKGYYALDITDRAAALTANAIPKSATITRPLCMRMFSGLMSR